MAEQVLGGEHAAVGRWWSSVPRVCPEFQLGGLLACRGLAQSMSAHAPRGQVRPLPRPGHRSDAGRFPKNRSLLYEDF